MNYSNMLVRATNWVGDAVMSLPALRAVREKFPEAHIAILAKPWVADLYRREHFANEVISYAAASGPEKIAFARSLRGRKFDCALLLQNAFEAALLAWVAGIPERIGYARDGRGFLLTRAPRVPKPGEIPAHQQFYYLELLRRAGWIEKLPQNAEIQLEVSARRIVKPIVGVSPGAAYGSAKRWLPERFAGAAAQIASERGAAVRVFGSANEKEVCDRITSLLHAHEVTNYAGRTSLAEFMDLAAECELFLTNDSGAMHIASALGVPTVAIFGATDPLATGPTGPLTRVVRETVHCSPCLLRECPIDHRCMKAVSAERVAREALNLIGAPQAYVP